MKWMMIPAVCAAVFVPHALADLAGPSEVPAQAAKTNPKYGPYEIELQKSITIELPDSIAGVSIGSSHVLNVAVHNKHLMFITGRAYGTTSLHVVDERGNVVLDTSISVVSPSESGVVLTLANQNYTLNCTPRCRPAPTIGDNADFFSMTTDQAGILAGDAE